MGPLPITFKRVFFRRQIRKFRFIPKTGRAQLVFDCRRQFARFKLQTFKQKIKESLSGTE
jgi:hypothetical protein